jgi:hypothetical protein
MRHVGRLESQKTLWSLACRLDTLSSTITIGAADSAIKIAVPESLFHAPERCSQILVDATPKGRES